MTEQELLEWCYRHPNSTRPSTVTIDLEELKIDSKLIRKLVKDMYDDKYIFEPLYASSFIFVELTDYGLQYCRVNFD